MPITIEIKSDVVGRLTEAGATVGGLDFPGRTLLKDPKLSSQLSEEFGQELFGKLMASPLHSKWNLRSLANESVEFLVEDGLNQIEAETVHAVAVRLCQPEQASGGVAGGPGSVVVGGSVSGGIHVVHKGN